MLKYGYGKATDHVSRDIRLGRISREDGINLVRKYDHIEPKGLRIFLDWLGITKNEFFSFIEPFKDLKMWKKNLNE